MDEILDDAGGDGIEGAARFVEEDHLGIEGEGAGDAEALLLAAGKGGRVLMESVRDFVPETDFTQGLLDAIGNVALAPAVFLEGDLEIPPD